MINVAICDDDTLALHSLVSEAKRILGNTPEFHYYSTTLPKSLIEYCTCTAVSILLLDIEMPIINGFDVAKWLSNHNTNAIVIFITNIDMYVYEAFKYHPFRFIRKSHIEDLEEAMKSALLKLEARKEIYTIQVNSQLSFEVKIDDIVYFESQHNNVKIVTVHGDNIFRATLKSIETELCNKGFNRIYSSRSS